MQLHRDFGRVEAQVAALQRQLDVALPLMAELQKQVAAIAPMGPKVDEVHTWMQQARGGWKGMVMCGAIGAGGATFLANIGTVWSFLRGH